MNDDEQRDIAGATAGFNCPVVKVTGGTLCRCRWCNRNDVPMKDMAIYSWKQSYGGFTGVCKSCMQGDQERPICSPSS